MYYTFIGFMQEYIFLIVTISMPLFLGLIFTIRALSVERYNYMTLRKKKSKI